MLRKTSSLLALVLLCGMGQTDGALRADEPVKTGQQRDTLLYVRTDPPGAKVFFNGKELGTTNQLFQVEPGKGTLTIEWDGRKAGETEVTIRANAVTRVELSLQTQPEAAGGRFIAHLSQGTVELVGVTKYPPTERSQWWKPDGSAVDLGPFLDRRLQVPLSSDETPRTFLLHFENLPEGASWPAWDIQPCAGNWEGNDVVDAYGKVIPEYKVFSAELGKGAGTADLRVGIAVNTWETVITQETDSLGTSSFRRDGREWTVTFLKAEMADVSMGNSTRVTLTSTEPDGIWKKRLTAVTTDGVEHATSIGYRGGDGTAVFSGLPLSSVKEFRYQVRPFSWVEFKNIALQSGQKTDVKAVSSGEPATSEK